MKFIGYVQATWPQPARRRSDEDAAASTTWPEL